MSGRNCRRLSGLNHDPLRLKNEIFSLKPDNLEAHFDLGRVYAIKGDREHAVAEFRYIFTKEPDFALYHYEMGRILEAWGDPTQALNHYRRALIFNPNLEPVNQAIKRLQSAVKESPPNQSPPNRDRLPAKSSLVPAALGGVG